VAKLQDYLEPGALILLTLSRREHSLELLPGLVQTIRALEQGTSAGVVEKHVASVFAKLGLAPSDNDNRRVIAAIRYLES
jgi:hypothetical protein